MILRKTCRKVDSLLWSYETGILSSELTRMVKQHLADCAACAERAAVLQATCAGMRALRDQQPPQSRTGWYDLSARLQAAEQAGRTQSLQRMVAAGMTMAVACSVAVFLASGHRSRGSLLIGPMDVAIDRTDSEPERQIALRPLTTVRPPASNRSSGAAAQRHVDRDEAEDTGAALTSVVDEANDDAPHAVPVSHVDSTPKLRATSRSRSLDALGVQAAPTRKAPDTHYVLDSVGEPETRSETPNYVMGSVPGPQTVSAHDGQGRSETL